MKLLYCKNCHDIIKLQYTPRFCRCERIGGVYVNILDIAVFGEKKLAVPLGIANPSFYKAIDNQPIEDLGNNGEVFLSFIIPKECSRVMYDADIKDYEKKEVPIQFTMNFKTKADLEKEKRNETSRQKVSE